MEQGTNSRETRSICKNFYDKHFENLLWNRWSQWSNVYLAGKISRNDWRKQFVDNLDHVNRGEFKDEYSNLVYVGPYFSPVSEHGSCHSQEQHGNHVSSHGLLPISDMYSKGFPLQKMRDEYRLIVHQSLAGVCGCGTVIAAVSDDAYGTLIEIGYAKAEGKRVVVVNKGFDHHLFAEAIADECYDSIDHAISIQNSVARCIWAFLSQANSCESVAETLMLYAIGKVVSDSCNHHLLDSFATPKKHPKLVCEIQFNASYGKYRLDISSECVRRCVEIDGLAYHNGQESFIRDRARQRALESDGWRVLRFAAKEVFDNPQQCALDSLRHLTGIGSWEAGK